MQPIKDKEPVTCFIDSDLKLKLKIKAAETKQTMTAYVTALIENSIKSA
jgi:hypothetical protein